MAKCWTCGEYQAGSITGNLHFNCPSCRGVKEIQNLREASASNLGELLEAQQSGFEELSRALSEGLSDIASAIEWGFENISWELQQQTEVLRSIDQTLKTPSETQANEWRSIAERLMGRRVFDKAEEFFLKALGSNPLDYRIYIGLAWTYLRMNRFDEARIYLEKSLPHAPFGSRSGEEFDYQSYSYRLIAHIYFCEEEYSDAIKALERALRRSPEYHEAIYDLSQCYAQMGNSSRATKKLEEVIAKEPAYFHLARTDESLEPVSSGVKGLLNELADGAVSEIKEPLAKSKRALEQLQEAFSAAVSAQKRAEDFREWAAKAGKTITVLMSWDSHWSGYLRHAQDILSNEGYGCILVEKFEALLERGGYAVSLEYQEKLEKLPECLHKIIECVEEAERFYNRASEMGLPSGLRQQSRRNYLINWLDEERRADSSSFPYTLNSILASVKHEVEYEYE